MNDFDTDVNMSNTDYAREAYEAAHPRPSWCLWCGHVCPDDDEFCDTDCRHNFHLSVEADRAEMDAE